MSSLNIMAAGCFLAFAVGGCTHDGRRSDNEPVASTRASRDVQTTRDDTAKITKVDVDNSKVDADNSKVNRVEGTADAKTADDQSDGDSDVDLTQKIRRSLTEDDNLSVYAHNVKIITEDGRVILKGPVRSLDEKATVETRARKYAGNSHVQSELTVVPR